MDATWSCAWTCLVWRSLVSRGVSASVEARLAVAFSQALKEDLEDRGGGYGEKHTGESEELGAN